MREGISIEMSAADRERLAAVVADRNSSQKHVWRARIILATAEGYGTSEIMRRAGVSKPCVWRWQERFMREGVAGLLREKTRKPGLPPLPPALVDRVVALTPFAGSRPPAALFFYSPDRKGEHPQAHLKDFRGVIHADGYAGFNELFIGGRIVEAGCWAHVRRKFFDVHAATGSPIAKEALDRIGQLYAVEKMINGSPSERRRQQRQLQSKPIAEALAAWAEETLRQLSRKSELAQAFRYMRARWTALVRCFDDGRLALDNNPAERALRCVAMKRSLYPLPQVSVNIAS
jgi:hypothetical protein